MIGIIINQWKKKMLSQNIKQDSENYISGINL